MQLLYIGNIYYHVDQGKGSSFLVMTVMLALNVIHFNIQSIKSSVHRSVGWCKGQWGGAIDRRVAMADLAFNTRKAKTDLDFCIVA